ncbi:class I SAM-dependent methyltransferase [Massilia sp. IC2-477]|uniref:class I SAM-dependent methyltransferase n=1 Tax=Massilia sp. IC2-477 TaxID=2887198 RepID=UPI001D1171AF|nr:class I SAM-dependent methyltransferase [Massilia sp. IC2-477]MCC2958183.1 class I SAM-dependent methyltransferase [Massilia sp. IC2-477]
MDAHTDKQAEQDRIREVYQRWHGGAALDRYAWHRPEILQQVAARSRAFAALLSETLGGDLSALKVLDVGCGTGGFLRQLIDWGADPDRLTGTELQQDRLDYARHYTAAEVSWRLGTLDTMGLRNQDLVSAQTVFSSILDDALRRELAAQMWRALRPGGWVLVFDFRYDNPRNRNVRKVTRAELVSLWPGERSRYRTLMLAPPIHRLLARAPWMASDLLAAMAPPLRSHFMYMVQKGV